MDSKHGADLNSGSDAGKQGEDGDKGLEDNDQRAVLWEYEDEEEEEEEDGLKEDEDYEMPADGHDPKVPSKSLSRSTGGND